ncbi:MAG: hypothetical protein VR73_10290 [Gammaproteobacteria bacterium BRH_c0]|nr:MAG: hypothetical protein VR73_10290 [Gammaproteobacteria bacterium BRH_c0]
MDTFVPALPAPKRCRCHSPQCKAEVLKTCSESRNTIDGVAQRYGVNANLVHKLRQQFPQQPASGLSG